jgi:Tissue inhibitor of metalloproteinase
MKKATLLVALFLTLIQFDAFACKCRQQTIEENMASADHVFSGKVMKIKTSKSSQQITVFVRVAKQFKGKIRFKTIEITTSSEPSACGVNFQKGREYVIYANNSDKNRLNTSSCTRTTESVKEETEGILELKIKN